MSTAQLMLEKACPCTGGEPFIAAICKMGLVMLLLMMMLKFTSASLPEGR